MKVRSLILILFSMCLSMALQAETWIVTVGGEAVNGTWTYDKFYPADLTVHAGDTVTFRFATMHVHNVVFPIAGQPIVSGFGGPPPGGPAPSGQAPGAAAPAPGGPGGRAGGPAQKTSDTVYDGTKMLSSGMQSAMDMAMDYTLTFPKTGDFIYSCTLHARNIPSGPTGMYAWLHVKAAGATLPLTVAAAQAQAQAQITADVKSAEQADPDAHKIATRSDGNGHTIYTVPVGWTSSTGGDFLGFGTDNLQIKVGDTVEWIQKAEGVPHTVTFYDGGKRPARGAGGPNLFGPSGGPTYDGTGYVNSGNMPGTKTGQKGPSQFSLTFTKAGTFPYVCLPHESMGMVASITVL